MSEPTATTINLVREMRMSDDGEYLLVSGLSSTVALHYAAFHEMLAALPNAIESVERMAPGREHSRFALTSTGWQVGRIDGTDNVVVRFLLQGNAGLSFTVPAEHVAPLAQALSAAAAAGSVPELPMPVMPASPTYQ